MLTTDRSFFRTHFFAFHAFNSSLDDVLSIIEYNSGIVLHQFYLLHQSPHGKHYCTDDFGILVLGYTIDRSSMDELMSMVALETNQRASVV